MACDVVAISIGLHRNPSCSCILQGCHKSITIFVEALGLTFRLLKFWSSGEGGSDLR